MSSKVPWQRPVAGDGQVFVGGTGRGAGAERAVPVAWSAETVAAALRTFGVPRLRETAPGQLELVAHDFTHAPFDGRSRSATIRSHGHEIRNGTRHEKDAVGIDAARPPRQASPSGDRTVGR